LADPTHAAGAKMNESAVRHEKWDEIPLEKVTDTITRRLFTGERMMLAHVYLDKGAIVPTHAHENEQLTYVVEGALRFWIGKEGSDDVEELVVGAGEVLYIPSHVPHKAEALEDTLDIDVFSPPRQDWLDGTDSYFQDG
jgi:unsaturated pyranuronate lyase